MREKFARVILFILFPVFCMLWSCDTDEGLPFPELSVEPVSELLEFSAFGTETYTFTVKTNQPSWDATSDQAWCVVTPNKTNNTFTVTATENRSVYDRPTATISIIVDKYDHATQTMKAEQTAGDYILMDGSAVAAASFSSGTGSYSSPYTISTPEDLQKLMEDVNKGINYYDSRFLLTRNVVIEAAEWTPIGSGSNTFDGLFDGGGRTVSGTMRASGYDYLGFFGSTGVALIMDLTVSADVVNNFTGPGECFTGAFSGKSTGTAFQNCNFTGSLKGGASTGGNSYAGGITGSITDGIIEDCVVSASAITGSSAAVSEMTGGITGAAIGGDIWRCDNYASVKGAGASSSYSAVGGIAGYVSDECIVHANDNHGAVTSSGISYLGGVVGYNDGGAVFDCNSTAGSAIGYGDAEEHCDDDGEDNHGHHGHEHSAAALYLKRFSR